MLVVTFLFLLFFALYNFKKIEERETGGEGFDGTG